MNEDTLHNEIMQGLGKLEGLYTGIIARLDYANGRTGKLEVKLDLLEKTVDKQANKIDNLETINTDGKETKSEISKWAWGALEKIIFLVIGAVISIGILVLQNAHILNLTPQK